MDLRGSSGNSLCQYEQCNKPVLRRGENRTHRFCGQFHRDLFMAQLCDRFQSTCSFLGPPQDLQQGRCRLPGCEAPKSIDRCTGQSFEFCRKLHAYEYMQQQRRQWSELGRLCRFMDCFRHVHVDGGNGKAYGFCSMDHAALATRARSNSHPQDCDPRATPQDAMSDNLRVRDSRELSYLQDLDTDRGYEMFTKSNKRAIVAALRESLRTRAAPRNLAALDTGPFRPFCVGINIFNFHPWELVSEEKKIPRYFLYVLHDGHEKASLSTKEGFHWKQSSRPKVCAIAGENLQIRYFTYKMKSKDHSENPSENPYEQLEQVPHRKTNRWRLHLISLEATDQCHAVIWKIFQNIKKTGKCRRDVSNQISEHEQTLEQENPTLSGSVCSALEARAHEQGELYCSDYSSLPSPKTRADDIVRQYGRTDPVFDI